MAKECLRPTGKRPKQYATLTMEVEPQIVPKGKKKIVRVSVAVCEERVASEATVLQVQGSIGTQLTFMLSDS